MLLAGCAGQARLAHTCSATDRAFIRTASLNMTALGTWGEDYLRGEAKASEVVEQARIAARMVDRARPTDPALEKTRLLMGAMFTEYGRAIQAKAKRQNAGQHMYRAYGLANFAHQILTQAEPGLRARGCDVSQLL